MVQLLNEKIFACPLCSIIINTSARVKSFRANNVIDVNEKTPKLAYSYNMLNMFYFNYDGYEAIDFEPQTE